MNELSKQESMTRALAQLDLKPALLEDETRIVEYTKVPISRLEALGVGFQPLVQAVESFSGNGTGLYHVVVPQGGHLASFKNGAGNLGAVLSNSTNQVSGQAVLNPVAFNPTMIFMAVALANIDKKLDTIQATQKEMFDFLKQKEKSTMYGNLNVLSDISVNYKHNWDNKQYKEGQYKVVLDIKRDAEQEIDLHRGLIKDKVAKKNLVHIDKDVKKQIEELQPLFKDYQLALYMYAFSTFLEVMLLENYDAKYLASVSEKIETYSVKYQELYLECFSKIENYSKSSVQTVVLKGLSKASKASGKFIEKVPIISKSQLDENLISASDKLSNFNSLHTDKILTQFMEKEQEYVQPFVEGINMINKLYNNDLGLAFNGENLFIGVN